MISEKNFHTEKTPYLTKENVYLKPFDQYETKMD